ncbi:MAG: hypothetical protein ACI35J_05015 [Peribacillus sp.]
MKSKIAYIACLVCLLVISGCTSSKVQEPEKTDEVSVIDETPSFVTDKDLDQIDWERKAVEFRTSTNAKVIGNENRLGIIGPELKANKVEKWLWHFWGMDKGVATFVGYHRNTSTIHSVLIDGEWSRGLTGSSAVNGADGSVPSNVMLPDAGEWAILVYSDGELFDTLVMDVKEEQHTSHK